MTWEWVFLIIAAMACGTVVFHLWQKKNEEDFYRSFSTTIDDITSAKRLLSEQVENLQFEIDRLKSSFSEIQKTSDETKRLLSQANMTAAFMPRSMRQGGG